MYTDEGLQLTGYKLLELKKILEALSLDRKLTNDEKLIILLIEDTFSLKRKLEDNICVCCNRLRAHDPDNCPTYFDGCNCGADVVETLSNLNLELELKLKQAEEVLSAKPWEHKEDGDA